MNELNYDAKIRTFHHIGQNIGPFFFNKPMLTIANNTEIQTFTT